MPFYLLFYDESGTVIIAWIIGVVLGIFLYSAIIRAIFRIDRQVDNQRAMIWLLIKNWEKQGATPDEVDKFVKAFNIK